MNIKRRLLSLMLAAIFVVGAFAGCSKQVAPTKTNDNATVSDTEMVESILPEFTKEVEDKKAENEDTVGWLQVPSTTINDVVVQNKENNDYYLRLNFDLEYEFQGVFYNDYRCDFGDGKRENLPINNVIYGHALTDNPESESYNVKFAPLHEFRDIEFAAENPYIFFSTAEGNFVYEIFSVFEANSDNPANPYNKGNAEKGDFHKVVKEEIIPRSYYDYGVEINDDDKFITLSTCIYTTEDGTKTYYPNTYYRYAIMARLIEEDAPLIEKLELKENKDRVIDTHEKMNV